MNGLSALEMLDASTAETLYWKRVPFLFKAPDREEIRETFTVRILSGVTKTNHTLRVPPPAPTPRDAKVQVLRVNVSTEADLLFLHTLEVTEDDFQGLKVEQGILVDFSHFPEKLITLLEKCRDAQEDEFQAELTTCGAESSLRIVETNDFNKLARIALKIRPGSDHAVKSFLAFRLGEVDQHAQSLQHQLSQAQTRCEELESQLKERDAKWGDLKERYDSNRLEAQAETKRIQLEAEERLQLAKSDLKALHEKCDQPSIDVTSQRVPRERSEMERKLNAQLEMLMTRYQDLEMEHQQLRDLKYDLDKDCSELRHRLAMSEGRATSLHQDCETLRVANSELTHERQQLTVDLSHMRAEIHALTEKVGSAEKFAELQRNRISDLDAAKGQLERVCEELRAASVSHERSGNEQSQELKEAKFVIQKLARDLHGAKEKHCHLRAILSRQEELVSRQSHQIQDATSEKATLERTVQSLKSENDGLKNEIEKMTTKLSESAHQLRENENMIGWLHKQINSSTVHRGKLYAQRGSFESYSASKSASDHTSVT